MIFTVITEDLQRELKRHFPQIRMLLKKNPAIAYKRIGEIGKDVGKKYKIELLVNFPHEGKIDNFEMYGAEEGWEHPDVGDLVEIASKSSLKTEVGVVVEPNEYIKNDHLWAQVLLNNGKMKILPKRDLKVIQRGEG